MPVDVAAEVIANRALSSDYNVLALAAPQIAAAALADRLRGSVGGFKIGSRLFTSEGPAFVEELASRGVSGGGRSAEENSGLCSPPESGWFAHIFRSP